MDPEKSTIVRQGIITDGKGRTPLLNVGLNVGGINNLSPCHCRVWQAVNGRGGLEEEFAGSAGDNRVQAWHRVTPSLHTIQNLNVRRLAEPADAPSCASIPGRYGGTVTVLTLAGI